MPTCPPKPFLVWSIIKVKFAPKRGAVQSAIAELGYRPNLLAQSLVNRRSKTIAVVASGIEYFGSSRTILGIERQSDELGYSLVLNLTPRPKMETISGFSMSWLRGGSKALCGPVPQIGDNRRWLAQDSLEQSAPDRVFEHGTPSGASRLLR